MNNKVLDLHYTQKQQVKMKIQDITPFILFTKSNNWLKLHGFPVRRGKLNKQHKEWLKNGGKDVFFDELGTLIANSVPRYQRVVTSEGHKMIDLKTGELLK